MQDLGGIRFADIPRQFPNWLVAADRTPNELLGPQNWLIRKGSGDRGLDQPTFKDWCQDPRGVVLAETTPKQIAMADDAGCRLELLRGSLTMPRAADDPRPENVSHVHGAESSWMLAYARVSGMGERSPDIAPSCSGQVAGGLVLTGVTT